MIRGRWVFTGYQVAALALMATTVALLAVIAYFAWQIARSVT